MISRMRSRASYANITATIALVVALGGVSYAAISVPQRSVGSKQLKLHAVRRPNVHKHAVGAEALRQNAVGPKSIQGNAIGPDQLAPDSVNARAISDKSVTSDDLDPTAAMPRLFAHVNSSGILGDSAGVERASRRSKGIYDVTFNRDLHGCVAVASVGFGFGTGVIGAGATAQAKMNDLNDPRTVEVDIYRGGYTFSNVEDSDFHLIVAC